MAERPFMQFYGSDFVGDTLHLSAEQIGAYMLLLIAMWNAKGTLPNDPKKLARVARVTLPRWEKMAPDLMAFFEFDEIEIWHKRMRKNLKKLEEKSSINRVNGSKGGAANALKFKAAPVAKAIISEKRNSSIVRATPEPEPESEGFSRENPKRTAAAPPSRFPEFWSIYPHKVGKPDALKAFDRAMKRVDFDTMMEGLARYVGKSDDRPWCNPSTWLNQDRWADQPAQVQRQSRPGREPSAAELSLQLYEQMEQANERSAEAERDHPPFEQYAIAGPRGSDD